MSGRVSPFVALALVGVLAACSAIPDKPVRATLYDFGPVVSAQPQAVQQPSLPALVMADIEAPGSLDGTAVLYRLGYADDHQLRPYAHARWSAAPPQLIRQRLRQRLGQERPVLDLGESAALARDSGAAPRVLRIGLEEFSQLFETESQSWGLVRLRVTLMENSAAGERLLAQRNFIVRKPAPTADAPGGVRALAAATDAAAEDIVQWLKAPR
jgi:cholesterol transport system auxiliary component